LIGFRPSAVDLHLPKGPVDAIVPLRDEGPGLDRLTRVAERLRHCEDRQRCRIAQGRERMRSAC